MSLQKNDPKFSRIKASVVDHFTDFISIANKDREIIYCNPAAYRMMGYAPHERPEITSTAQLHAEGFDAFAAREIQPAVFKNGSWNGLSAIRHKDGSTIMVDMTVFPLYDDAGEEYGTVAVMRDVNELTKLNLSLQKSSALFQEVLDSVMIGIILINMETNQIEMANKRTAELLQIELEDIIGQKCYDILCHNSLALCPHINERDQRVLLGERYLARKDGTSLPIIKTGTWITIEGRDYLVDTLVDISIQKELEENLKEAKLQAEAANNSKSEFLSRMSHEMRTPLTAVIGMSQIAEKTRDVKKLKDCLETIHLSSNHLLNLINDILDLSKIEEGKLELAPDTFSLSSLVDKTLALIRARAEEKRIGVYLDMSAGIPPYLVGDSLRLSQVLLNLLSNAVKFTPEDKRVFLRIRLDSQDADQVTLQFDVADQGIGMTREQMDRLFQPFVQADGSIARNYGGTGLGLVISKRIIGLMGSDILVESIPNQGATFSFSLTLPISQEEERRKPAVTISPELLSDRRVLIVDDMEINRLITMELLADTRMIFDEASDGLEAIAKALAHPYDLILMDIQMPFLDGYSATQQIRKGPEPYCHVPIVAMSANVFREDMERSLAIGMDGHVGKPINLDELMEALGKIFYKDGAGEADSEKHRALIRFRPGAFVPAADLGYFNYPAALKHHHGDAFHLASLCHDFLQEDLYGKLKDAMDTGAFTAAGDIVSQLLSYAHAYCLNSLASYAGNVQLTLTRGDYKYAAMYLADLGKCYARTQEVLRELLV